MQFAHLTDDSAEDQAVKFDTVLAVDTWYHVALERNGDTNRCCVDVNGETTTSDVCYGLF